MFSALRNLVEIRREKGGEFAGKYLNCGYEKSPKNLKLKKKKLKQLRKRRKKRKFVHNEILPVKKLKQTFDMDHNAGNPWANVLCHPMASDPSFTHPMDLHISQGFSYR